MGVRETDGIEKVEVDYVKDDKAALACDREALRAGVLQRNDSASLPRDERCPEAGTKLW